MNNGLKQIIKAQAETQANRTKALYNHSCKKVDNLKPYDNTEFLKMVGLGRQLLRDWALKLKEISTKNKGG